MKTRSSAQSLMLLAAVLTCLIAASAKAESGAVAKKVAEFKETIVVGGLDFNADGSQLAINAMFDGRDVHIWDWRTPSHIALVLHKDAAAGDGSAVRYSPDGMLLGVGHAGEVVKPGTMRIYRVWNVHTRAVVHDVETSRGGSGVYLGLAFSPDGRFLICVVQGGFAPGDHMVVYSTETWERLWGLDTLPVIPRRLALSPDGQHAALAGLHSFIPESGPPGVDRPKILIVNMETHQAERTIDMAFPDHNEIQAVAWSPDGKTLAAGAIVQGTYPGPDAVRLFDAATGTLVGDEHADNAGVYGLSYSPDGRYLIEGYIDGKVRIWDGQHKQLLQSMPVDDHFHTVLGVSRDSRYLAIAAGKGIAVWQLK